MKRNTSFAKITLAAILFQSHFALAGDNYTQQTNSDVNSAAELQPLVCPKVPQSPWFGSGTPPMVDEPACVQENNRRAQARAAAQGVQQTAGNVSTGDGTTLVAPTAPTYTCGSMDPYSSQFQSCKSAYDSPFTYT